MRRAGGEDGFTLVEMLVSLALLATAAGLMMAGVSASRGAWGRMQRREEAGESVSAAETRLRALLEQMVVRARFETERPYADVGGDDHSIVFASAPPLGERPAADVRRELALSEDGELTVAPAGAQGAGADVLLKGATGLEVGYYGQDGGSGEPAWRSDWTRQPGPPELIRVRVSFPAGDRRVWPELIVRPAAMVDVQCLIDGDTGACRGRA